MVDSYEIEIFVKLWHVEFPDFMNEGQQGFNLMKLANFILHEHQTHLGSIKRKRAAEAFDTILSKRQKVQHAPASLVILNNLYNVV
jgi:hypothetical protein